LCGTSPSLSPTSTEYSKSLQIYDITSIKFKQSPILDISQFWNQIISQYYLILNICSSLKLRQVVYLTNVHFTIRPFCSSGRSPQYPLNIRLTGRRTQSEGCWEGNFSDSCRKFKYHFLVFHHVTSALTQIETSNYYILIKSRSFSTFSVPYCGLLLNTLIGIFLYNTVFWTLDFLQVKGYVLYHIKGK
jgi:hypothetical protein